MGKVSSNSRTFKSPYESDERMKKKKRKKDLEEIRRNALAVKRELRNKPSANMKGPKTKLTKTLNQFASLRSEIEEANQTQGSLLSRQTVIKNNEVPKSLKIDGFFRAGIKGRLITRPCSDATQEKIKKAILENDALALMQSANYNHRSHNTQSSSANNVDSVFKIAADKILHPSSDSDSNINSELVRKSSRCSPILGGHKNFRKKIVQTKSNATKTTDNTFQNDSSLPSITKEEKIRRRLFEKEQLHVNNKNTESTENQQESFCDDLFRFSPQSLTPENEIFLSKQVPQKNINNNSISKAEKTKIDPTDPHLIKFYSQTCKLIAEKEIKSIPWENLNCDDPLEASKAILRTTYTQTLNEFLSHQKNSLPNPALSQHTSVSSRSEIMLEPDSAIARTVKKNAQHKFDETPLKTAMDSDSGSNHSKNLENDYPAAVDVNRTKRKRTPSSKGGNSELEFPSSVRANADPKSVKCELKMNYIHPDKQELVARYLNDVRKHENEKITFMNKNLKDFDTGEFLLDEETQPAHKSGKHVPAILRKNKNLADKLVLEKKIQSHMTKHYGSRDMLNNFENSEASNSRYEHSNYKKPFMVNVPTEEQSNGYDSVSQRHHHHYLVSRGSQPQSIQISPPIAAQTPFNYPDQRRRNGGFHRHVSQESYSHDCMTRGVSFGDIQERTNRLSLRSSQNCSDETDLYSSHDDSSFYHHQQPKGVPFANVSRESYSEAPSPLGYNVSINSNYDNRTYKLLMNFKEKSPRVYQTVVSPEDFSLVTKVAHQRARQPVKYIAVESDLVVPQRMPVYEPHQESIPNQQYFQPVKPVYKVPKQRIPQTVTSSDYEMNRYRQAGRMVPSATSTPTQPRLINFVPSNNLSSQQGAPGNGQRLVEHRRLVQVPSPICSQVEYQQRTRHLKNEGRRVNAVYVQPVNRNSHCKRP